MSAESVKARMERGEKMLKLFESGLTGHQLAERFGMKTTAVFDALMQARARRERAKEKAQ